MKLKDLLFWFDPIANREAVAESFSPLSVSGLILWLDASTITASNNDPITTWEDSSPYGNDVTQATSANRPIYKSTGINNRSSVLFDGLNDFFIAPNIAPSNYTKIVVCMPSGITGKGNNTLSAGTGQGHALRILDNGDGTGRARITNNSTTQVNATSPTIASGIPIILMGIRSPLSSGLISFVNGAYSASDFGSTVNTDATLEIGSFNNGTNVFTGLIAEAFLINNAASGIVQTQLHQYLNDRYNIATAQRKKLVFKGGSWTSGYNVTGSGTVTGDTYPAKVLDNLNLTDGVDIDGYNLGVYGQTILQMFSSTDIYQRYNALADKNVCVFWGGSNDIDDGTSANITYQLALVYSRRARSLGYKFIALTLIPRTWTSAANATARETARTTYNSLLNASTEFDEVIDVTDGTVFASSGIILNPTYYQADNIHLTATGYQEIADTVSTIIGTFL